ERALPRARGGGVAAARPRTHRRTACARVARPVPRGSRAAARDGRSRAASRAPARDRGTRGRLPRGGLRREGRGMSLVVQERMRRIQTIHFVGIGGSGMGGIAEVLLNLGYGVQGSDL